MRVLRPSVRDLDPRGRRPAPAPPAAAGGPAPAEPGRRPGVTPHAPALRLALTAALVAGPAAVALGAAWTLPAGTGMAILTTTFTRGTDYLLPDGRSQRLAEYRKLESQALVEYGLTDGVTLMAMPTVFAARVGGPPGLDRYEGLGHTDLGARARIWHDERGVIALQALARIPGATDDQRRAQTGNTDAQGDFRLLAGRGFELGAGQTGWINAEAAYRLRLDDPPNEWRFDLTLGWRPAPGWALLAQSFNVLSDGEGRGIYPHYWYSKAQLSVLYDLTPQWSLQAGAFLTVAGENALRENGALVALWRRF